MDELLLPGLRCLMGKWVYYAASIQLGEVAQRVDFADDLIPSKALADLLQRNVRGSRKKQIADYLMQEPQHFLGTLIVAMHKGELSWLELDVRPSDVFHMEFLSTITAKRLQSSVGFLRLSGDERLWALDGQHRLSGIKEAIDLDAQLGKEEIVVLFVGHQDTAAGRERTRRLFTTLNRNGKPISTGERIALDEDDVCAILTRRLVEEHPLLTKDRVASAATGQLNAAQTEAFTVISMVYSVSARLLEKKTVAGQVWSEAAGTADRCSLCFG